MLKWNTEKRKINDLLPYEANPRLMREEQVEQLKQSITKYNLVEIPAINTDNTIIAGHQRLKIMQLLGRGEEEIDVRVPSRKLNKEELEEYLIRSNKNTGDWDWDLLSSYDKDFLMDLGFTKNELDIVFGLSDLIDYDKLEEELRFDITQIETKKTYTLSVENYIKLKEFAESLEEKENGHKVSIVKVKKINVTNAQAEIINQALEVVENDGIKPIGRALELICADFLGK